MPRQVSKHEWKPLLLVAYVFVFTGACICMNDILLPSLKESFSLSYVQASFVQQSFYLVYLIFPIPIAYFISRYGYKVSVITALVVCGVGATLFLPAFYLSSYPLVLIALFVISIGVTLVNVAANPLAALLGDPAGSHVRVNFVQLFSRIGYSVTPLGATRLIYADDGSINFHIPYLVLGTGTILFAAILLFSTMPSLKPEKLEGFTFSEIIRGAKNHPQLLFGAIAMFFYMGAEACTAGFYISYLKEVSGLNPDETARYLTWYYIASTTVCIAGIYLLQTFSAGRLIAIFGVGMVTMYLLAAFTNSPFNPYYLVGMGAFISIVFPCIFSLGIERIGTFTEKGSALINIAIVGGAVFPPLQGMLADARDVQISYLVPCACFIVIIAYGVYCDRSATRNKQLAVAKAKESPV